MLESEVLALTGNYVSSVGRRGKNRLANTCTCASTHHRMWWVFTGIDMRRESQFESKNRNIHQTHFTFLSFIASVLRSASSTISRPN